MSLIEQTYRQDIEKLRMCFDDTEKAIKHVEQATFELAIPSINQLRYVAYHILKASDNNNYKSIDEVKEEITKALHHCQRAKFDAVEIGMTFFLEEIRIFQETYSHIKETQDVLKNYSTYLSEAQNAADELKLIADEEKDRRVYYEKISPHYQKLKSIVDELKQAKPLIAVQVEQNNKNKIKDTRRFVITTILTIVGGVIAITMLLYKLGVVGSEKSNKDDLNKDTYTQAIDKRN